MHRGTQEAEAFIFHDKCLICTWVHKDLTSFRARKHPSLFSNLKFLLPGVLNPSQLLVKRALQVTVSHYTMADKHAAPLEIRPPLKLLTPPAQDLFLFHSRVSWSCYSIMLGLNRTSVNYGSACMCCS